MGFRLYLSTSVTVMQIQKYHTVFLFFVVLFCTVLGFTVLLGLPLALTILMTFGGRIRWDSVFVALVGFGCWIRGGFSPGQLLKTWTSLTSEFWWVATGGSDLQIHLFDPPSGRRNNTRVKNDGGQYKPLYNDQKLLSFQPEQ